MKKILIIVESVFFALLLLGCTEVLIPGGMSDEALSGGTKGPTKLYCWYHGEQIPLTLNQNYVNILLDTAVVKGADVSTLFEELGLEKESEPDRDGLCKAALKQPKDYYRTVDALRSDVPIRKVLPFYDFGKGAEPVGSSHFFYVQLKELFPEDKQEGVTIPYLEKKFDVDALHQEAERLGLRIVREVAYMPDWYVLSIEESGFETAVEAANCVYETGRFEAIDPAFMFVLAPFATNDPLFSQQWGLKNTTYPGYDINVEGAWAISTGAGVKVAVVDNKIDPFHIDLSSNYHSASYDVTTGYPCTFIDGEDHGTFVAGIVGAVGNNNNQIAGVAYDSKIMRVRRKYEQNDNYDLIASGINWAWQNGADIINCSWGEVGAFSQLLETSIVNAMTFGRSGKGTVVVCALGNTGDTSTTFPACVDSLILTVGAIGRDGYRWTGSTYGLALDVVAPGDEVISTLPCNTTGLGSGTSFAAPHVSGVAALMLSANPNLKREEVVRFIELTAKKISPGGAYTYYSTQNRWNGKWNTEMGYGLVDAAAAVTVAQYAGSTPPAGSPSMDFVVMSAVGAVYNDYIVMASIPQTIVHFSLLPSQTNSSYTYYWHFTTTGDPFWYPSYYYVGNDPGVDMNIPRPSTNSVLEMRCEIYSGSTHLYSAHFDLGVRADFP